MRTFDSLALCALLLAPLAATAADLTFQVDGQVEYDDNAFRQRGEQDDDVLFRIRPGVKLHEDRGEDLDWSLLYAVPFEFAVENGDELDDIDHVASGQAQYRANERLEIFASNSFRYLRSALRDVRVDDVLTGEGTFLINQERERTTLNDAELGLSYRFTPRLSGSLRATHEFFGTDRTDRADNWLLSGTAETRYVATPKHTVGIGVRVFHQQFDDRDNFPGSRINSYNAFGQWTWRIDETLSFEMSVGPTLIDSQQDDPDANVTVPRVPSVPAPVGADAASFGFVNPDGSPAAGTITASNAIVVSQLAGCPIIIGTSSPFFPNEGGVCPINPVSAPGILLDADDIALINAVQADNPLTNALAEGRDDTRLDVFGEATLRKDWSETLRTALRYRRTQGGASGLGGAVIADVVNLSNTWDIAEKWQLALRGDWSMRQTVVDDGTGQFILAGDPGIAGFTGVTPAGTNSLVSVSGGGSSEIDTMRWGVAGRLTHRFTRNTSSYVQLTYNEQTSRNDTLGETSDFDNILASIGVRHVFDPIKLW